MLARLPRISLRALTRCARPMSGHPVPTEERSLQARPTIETEAKQTPLTEEDLASTVIRGRALWQPISHPKLQNVPVASLHFRSHHPFLLDLFLHFAQHSASALGIPVSGTIHLPTQRSMWTVIRGPFVHKKSQENFERRVHKRAIKAWDADSEVVTVWVKYLRKHMMSGVGMRVTRWERASVGIGQQIMERDVAKSRSDTREAQVKALADQIVQQELLVDRQEVVID